jgi:hypothetical protein
MKDQLVVLAERPALAGSPERRHVTVGHNRQLECAVEARSPAGMALAHDASVLVLQREAAVQVVADDREKRLDAAAADDRVRQPLVHGERACLLLELLVREVRERRLRDRHERHVVRNRKNREREFVCLVDDRAGHVGKAEAHPEAEARNSVLGKPADVRALERRGLADAEPGGEEELAALQPPGGIVQLGDVQPADFVLETVRARRDSQLELGKSREVPHRQHPGPFDIEAKRYARSRPEATGNPTCGPESGASARRPCRPWRYRAR